MSRRYGNLAGSEPTDANARKLIIPEHIWRKMYGYVALTKSEVSGFGKLKRFYDVVRRPDPSFELVDIKIFKQVCNTAHTQLSSEDLTNFYLEMIKQKEKPTDWYCWWHSHDDGSVFFSSTDLGTIEQLSSKGRVVSLCVNKLGAMTARYDTKGQTELLSPVIKPDIAGLKDELKLEIKRKVKVEGFRRMRSHGYPAVKRRHIVPIQEAIGYYRDYEGHQLFD